MKSNIVTEPDKKLNSFTVKFNVGTRKVEFVILANIKEPEIYAVLDNWFARTENYTADSLVNYINSKSHYGFKATLNSK